nr:hypothetical protein [Rubrobacter marinus]
MHVVAVVAVPISESSFVRWRRCSSIADAISLTTASVFSVALN